MRDLPLPHPVRVACRRRIGTTPRRLWERIEAPPSWAPLFVSPERAAPRRVKLLDPGEPGPGRHLHVLRADRTWTVYRIARWDPRRQVRLVAERAGLGQEPGEPVPGEHTERLILIPQGDDTEAEWTVERRGALLSRLVAEPGKEAWTAALEARLDALEVLIGLRSPRPED